MCNHGIADDVVGGGIFYILRRGLGITEKGLRVAHLCPINLDPETRDEKSERD